MYTLAKERDVRARLNRRRVDGPVLKARAPATAPAQSVCACGGGCPRCQQSLSVQGRSNTTLEAAKRRGELFIDGGETRRKTPGKAKPGAASAPPAPPPAQATPTCPTQIHVAEVGTLQLDASIVGQGWLTGIGGYAKMEVSDPGGRNWNGAAVHENVSSLVDSCGTADRSCSNRDGEGGDAGSTFTVGAAGNLLGIPLPAERNCFYDIHVVLMQDSLLHRGNKSTCVQKCYQQYECGGAGFGPALIVDKLLYRDMIVGEGVIHDVTRIDLDKYPA